MMDKIDKARHLFRLLEERDRTKRVDEILRALYLGVLIEDIKESREWFR